MKIPNNPMQAYLRGEMMTAFIGLMLIILYDSLFGPSFGVRLVLFLGWAMCLLLGFVSMIDWGDDDETDGENT